MNILCLHLILALNAQHAFVFSEGEIDIVDNIEFFLAETRSSGGCLFAENAQN